jgi:toxin ParE1/3/4
MYVLSEASARDIENIFERSLIDFGLAQTEQYFHTLKNCLVLLAENPGMGTAADDLQAGYRRFPHESHVIFYTVSESDIFIVRILHKSMDIIDHFDE